MINGKKIVVVLPAYNAALTLKRTYDEIPFDIVDDVVLVDDHRHRQHNQDRQQIITNNHFSHYRS